MKRVGILGGTFNPVHLGHLLVAHAVAEALDLERVLLLPAARPPHKPRGLLAAPDERLAMVRLSLAGDPLLDVSTLELDRGGTSYAVDTMRLFRAQNPDVAPCFIIGMDSLRELHSWHRVGELLELCTFATVDRPGVDRPVDPTELRLPPPWPERLLAGIVPIRTWEVSSSEIRRRIAVGRSIRYLVSPAVEAFIRERGLYRTKSEEDDD
jgi:nicotinate-nucleotide adenylyltransferase